jgi:hypothetical protein
LEAIEYRRVFPWIHLFRAFRIAVDLRKMVLASAALVALFAGDRTFRYLFPPAEAGAFEATAKPPWSAYRSPADSQGAVSALLKDPLAALIGVATNWSGVLEPLAEIGETLGQLSQTERTWTEIAFCWTKLLWMLIVWAIFGGAITRMAAVQFARDEKVSLRAALRFSSGRFLSYLSAPLLPLVGLGFFWLLCLMFGWMGRVPALGGTLVGTLGFVPLLFGFVMALILLGLAAGAPLMFPTISTEGSDAFDGFSRSYNYVFGRPWQYLGLVLLAIVYGSVVLFFVRIVAALAISLAGWALASGMGTAEVDALFGNVNAAKEAIATVSAAENPVPAALGHRLMGFWLDVVALLVGGFVCSYFWTASTIIYFLLRRIDDATALDEVYSPNEDESDDLLPLVGVAASDQPVIERPPPVVDGTEERPKETAPDT